MAFLAALWPPSLLSAVTVFVASFIVHMVLAYHRNDYSQLPDEDKILAAAARRRPQARSLHLPLLHPQGLEVPRPDRKAKAGTGRVPDHLSQRPARHAEVPDPVVRVLPPDRILRRLARRTQVAARRKLSGRLSRAVGTAAVLAYGVRTPE